jgi:predicted nucleotidyltransferase
MIPKNTSKIILYILKNINEFGYNVNQISKNLEISVGSAFKILKSLEKDKIVLHKEISNAKFFNLNLENPETIKICELLLLAEKREMKGYAKVYANEINKFDSAELIILFGSILKSKTFNDVDVLFVTYKIKQVKEFCLELTKVRTKAVVPLILKKEDLITEIKNNNEAILSLIKEGVVLKGESVFLEVIKNVKS